MTTRPDGTRPNLGGPPAPAPLKRGRWVGGAVCSVLALAALALPWLTIGGESYSVAQARDMCDSGRGELARVVNAQLAASCGRIDTAYVLCWVAVVAGAGLAIIGAVRGGRGAAQ